MSLLLFFETPNAFTLTAEVGTFTLSGQPANLTAVLSMPASIYGAEIINNGTFDTATTGWGPAGVDLSVVFNRMRVTKTGISGSGWGTQDLTLVPGKSYRLTYDQVAGTAPSFNAIVLDRLTLLNQVADTSGTLDFVATSADMAVYLGVIGAAVGEYWDFDNVSIKERPYTYTGQRVVDSAFLAAGLGTFTLSGQPANLSSAMNYPMAAGLGTFTYSGQAASTDFTMLAANASFSLTGQPVNLLKSTAGGADVGTFTLSGQPAIFTIASRIAAGLGTFSFAPQNVTLATAMPAGLGTFSMAGQDATLTHTIGGGGAPPGSVTMSADAGVFVLSGQNAITGFGLNMAAAVGTYTMSGQSVLVPVMRSMTAGAGIYSLAGQPATLTPNFLPALVAGLGTFMLTPQETRYTLSTGAAMGGGSSGPRVVAFML